MAGAVIPWAAVFGISAASLAYEILLLRLFAIIQWHDFAYLVISLALLGHGISGTVVVVWQRRLMAHYAESFVLNCIFFGVSSSVCFWLAQRVEFNSLEVIWQHKQWWSLAQIYGLLTVPFFFAANAIALTIVRYKNYIARLYACDLIGAGFGALATVILLYFAAPDRLLFQLSVLVLFVCVMADMNMSAYYSARYHWGVLVVLSALVTSFLIVPDRITHIKPVAYKALSKAKSLPHTSIDSQHFSPMGVVDVLDSQVIPLRLAPGLSLATTAPLPRQKAIFIDGDGPLALNHFPWRQQNAAESQRYLKDVTSAIAYHIIETQQGKPAILQVGFDHPALLQANLFVDASIDITETHTRLSALIREHYAEYSGWPGLKGDVTVHSNDVRGFLSSTSRGYDLINLHTLDAEHASLSALQPNFRFTIEAFSQYFVHLKQRGLLSVTSSITLPPRISPKILATALTMLRQQGVNNPARHVLLIRSWKTATLLVSKSPLTTEQITAAKSFCNTRWFDPVYFLGIDQSEVNRFNRLASPEFYRAAIALVQDSPHYIERYKFQIEPATDNQPFFYRFFKWAFISELLALRDSGGAALIDQGYPMLIVTLILALLFSILLIPLPILLRRKIKVHNAPLTPNDSLHKAPDYLGTKNIKLVLCYFFLVGLGFMFIEIAIIQRLVLFLDHAIISATVIISGFLIFAGLGSAYVHRYHLFPSLMIRKSIVLLIVCLIVYLLLLPNLPLWFGGKPLYVRAMVVVMLVAPIAFVMGMPFPLGLSLLAKQQEHWIAWAWGVNGCASVVSTILATLLAVHWGFSSLILLAAVFYGVAAILLTGKLWQLDFRN